MCTQAQYQVDTQKIIVEYILKIMDSCMSEWMKAPRVRSAIISLHLHMGCWNAATTGCVHTESTHPCLQPHCPGRQRLQILEFPSEPFRNHILAICNSHTFSYILLKGTSETAPLTTLVLIPFYLCQDQHEKIQPFHPWSLLLCLLFLSHPSCHFGYFQY